MGWLARIYVTPRAEVLDPQGKAVNHALHSLGFDEVEDVRLGRYLELRFGAGAGDRGVVEARLASMCERLLTNPVVEDWRFELVEAELAPS